MTPQDRDAAIAALVPMIRRIARRVKRLVPGFDLDDLIGDGCIGAIRAVDSFDASRGPSLEQYACRLALGAMLNGIRRMDPVSERARRAVREGENQRYALAAGVGRVPSVAEMDRQRPGYARALAAAQNGQPLSLDAPLPIGESLGLDWSADPAGVCERRDASAQLAAAIRSLPRRQQRLIAAHYFGERSLRSIGAAMSISSQRASQLHLNALQKLRSGRLRAAAD